MGKLTKLLVSIVVLPIGLVTVRGLFRRRATKEEETEPETATEHASLAAEHAQLAADLADDST